MIGLDAEDGGALRPQVEEVAAIFARFDQHQVAAAETPAGTGPQRVRADRDRGIQAGVDQDMGGHGGGGRFAVGAGDGQPPPAGHELPEHFGVAERGDAQFGGAATRSGLSAGTALE